MAKESKRYKAIKANVEPQKQYGLREALELCKANATAKFNESVELHVRLGVDPRQADQQVRGTVPLPHGTGVTKRVLVITMGEKLKEAEEAGADFVGSDDMVQKIEGGWLDFDAVVTDDALDGVEHIHDDPLGFLVARSCRSFYAYLKPA